MTTQVLKITIFVVVILLSLYGQDTSSIYVDEFGFALLGYDVVSFHNGTATAGDTAFSVDYKGAKWLFESEKHASLFKEYPERYEPKYGGYCAYGVSFGMKVRTDPRQFSLVDDTLYINLDERIKKRWERRRPHYISKANRKWNRVRKKEARN